MGKVFISYAREDRDAARKLASLLEQQGFEVWWDWNLVGGADFRNEIHKHLDECQKAIVLWSRASTKSAFVIDEANEAKRHGKLIPVSIGGSAPPFGFGDLHTLDFPNDKDDAALLVAALRNEAPPPARRASRFSATTLQIGAGVLAAALLAAVAIVGTSHLKGPARESAEAFGPRFALVVGNSEYRGMPRLANTVNDANKVAAALGERGFQVIKKLDLDRAQLTEEIERFDTMLARGGVGVFYYAGSATHSAGIDYLAPVDAPWPKEHSDYDSYFVNATALLTPVPKVFENQARSNGWVLFYAASKGQFASDGPPGGNSPFATAMLDALAHTDFELSDLKNHVTRKVRELSKGTQVPSFEGTQDTPFYFSKPAGDKDIGILKIVLLDACRDDVLGKAFAGTSLRQVYPENSDQDSPPQEPR